MIPSSTRPRTASCPDLARRAAVRTLLATLVLLVSVTEGAAAFQERQSAVDASVAYTADVAANVRGGLRRGVVGMGNLDATLRLDGAGLLGWQGTSLFLYGLANHGGKATELTGDAQVASNIEAPDAVRLYEAWIQKNVPEAEISVLVGLYDVNSEFDVLHEADLFLNSSFGIGAEFGNSGVNGPSVFPVTSLGARLQWHPSHEFYAQGAVLDGVPGDPGEPGATEIHLSGSEGVLWVAEVGYLAHPEPRRRREPTLLGRDHVHPGIPWRVAAGVWQYTRKAERIGGSGRVRAHPGVYALVEGRPYREADPEQGLSLFARVGFADDRTNRFAAYTGAGLTYTGALPGRDRDVLGIGVASAHDGKAFRSAREALSGAPVTGAETTVELGYRAVLAPWISLQPDIQVILDPNADPGLRDAVLPAIRVALRF